MVNEIDGLMTFSQRVALQKDRTIVELEEENARLRAKYAKALSLLREYKCRTENTLTDRVTAPQEPEAGDKVKNMWRDRLLRMNSVSPRKGHQLKQEELSLDKPVEVLELAEALNSGEIQLDKFNNEEDNFDEISELLAFRSS